MDSGLQLKLEKFAKSIDEFEEAASKLRIQQQQILKELEDLLEVLTKHDEPTEERVLINIKEVLGTTTTKAIDKMVSVCDKIIVHVKNLKK
jgi:uncharacterized protein YejL (UPF0352 family)